MRVFSQSLSVFLRLLFTRGEIKWNFFFCFIFLIGCGEKNSAVYRSLIENFEAKSEIKIAYEKPKSAVQKVEIRKIKPILEKIEPTQRPEIKPEISGTFDFKQLMVIADQRSPKLNAIRQEFNSIKQRYSQIDELNNLLVQCRFFTKQLQIPVGKSHHKSMINLRFPLPNTLTLKRKIIDIDLMIAEKKFDIAWRDLQTEIELAYVDLLFVETEIEVHQENLALLDLGIEIAQTKYRAGIETFQAVVALQIERSNLANQINSLADQRRTIHAQIQELIGVGNNVEIGSTTKIESDFILPDLSAQIASGLENRQEIQKMKLKIKRMELMIKMLRRMIFSDLANQPMASVRKDTNFSIQHGYVRELESQIKSMELTIENMDNAMRSAIEKHYNFLQTSQRDIDLYKNEIIPQAEQVLKVATTNYQSAQIDFLKFLEAQRTVVKFRLMLAQAIQSFRKHDTQLRQVIGRVTK